MTIRRLASTALALAFAAVALLLPSTASASRTQETIFEDDRLILQGGEEVRASTLDELKGLGVDTVKLRMDWRAIAPDPDSETKPSFDASDPSAYPASAWTEFDEAIRAIEARRMDAFLMLSPPAPEWATQPGELEEHPGVLRPDPDEFARFVEAVGRRYGRTAGLPRVRMWSLWNEPNHPQFLQPLAERLGGRLTPTAPHIYRDLYVAGETGLRRSGHRRDRVLFGEILPVGSEDVGPTENISPLVFLREFFCVDSRYRPYRGRAARLRGCTRMPRIRTSGFAYHPYTRVGGVRVQPPSRDDATIGQIERVEQAFDRIARTRRVRRGLPIYNTEFGVQTNPPECRRGETLDEQAAFMNEAEYISYRSRRVRSYNNYALVDEAIDVSAPRRSKKANRGFQTGLRFGENATPCQGSEPARPVGSPKEPGYDAFRTPLYVRRVDSRRVEIWGRARPRGRRAQSIQILRNGRVVERVRTRGYFTTELRRPATGRWSLRWRSGRETFTSREAEALRDPARGRR